MFLTIVTVKFYDEIDKHHKHETALIYAKNYSDAAAQIESYYGDTIESMDIQMYDEGLFRIEPENIYYIKEKM